MGKKVKKMTIQITVEYFCNACNHKDIHSAGIKDHQASKHRNLQFNCEKKGCLCRFERKCELTLHQDTHTESVLIAGEPVSNRIIIFRKLKMCIVRYIWWCASNTCCFIAVEASLGTSPLKEPRGREAAITHMIFCKPRDTLLVIWVVGVAWSVVPPELLVGVTVMCTPSLTVTMEERVCTTSKETGNSSGRYPYQSEGAAVVHAEGHGEVGPKELMQMSKGVITIERKNIGPAPAPFARGFGPCEVEGLSEGASLLGVVLKAMRDSDSSRPAIFAMSDPTKNAECTVAFKSVGENKFSSGWNPFENVNLGNGKVGHVNQANNMHLFPGIRHITTEVGAPVVQDAHGEVGPKELMQMSKGLITIERKNICPAAAPSARGFGPCDYVRSKDSGRGLVFLEWLKRLGLMCF